MYAFQFVSGFGFICRILAAQPTAELEPLTDGQVSQTDEVIQNCNKKVQTAILELAC